ncbi:MAG TPA: hypothetical protein VGR95_12495 [Thermoanaerobaculia bacterium]|jgi:hypothetical protein|nr:hypothetical protein [Thermoanaerobaculia bacterium]
MTFAFGTQRVTVRVTVNVFDLKVDAFGIAAVIALLLVDAFVITVAVIGRDVALPVRVRHVGVAECSVRSCDDLQAPLARGRGRRRMARGVVSRRLCAALARGNARHEKVISDPAGAQYL